MAWAARKSFKVTKADGTYYVAKPGEIIPEASSWKRPSVWCFLVPDVTVEDIEKDGAPSSDPTPVNIKDENLMEIGIKELRKRAKPLIKDSKEDLDASKMSKEELVVYLSTH